jgi:TrmH family RNA methyltransferase
VTPTHKRISSRDNPFFKNLKKLAGSVRQRGKDRQALLDGIHLVEACIDCGHAPLYLLVTADALHNREVAALLEKNPGIPLTLLDDGLFDELTELKTSSGIIAVVEQIAPTVAPQNCRFGLLLEDIQDPGNLGSMLRSAAAAGCDAVFLSAGCADAWSPRVLRAGMGGHFALSIHESADLLVVAAAFQGTLLATAPLATGSLYDCDLTGRLAFALGNEGAGLSQNVLAHCTRRIRIPMPGQVESLNAAAAAAVCLFEAVRQRGKT